MAVLQNVWCLAQCCTQGLHSVCVSLDCGDKGCGVGLRLSTLYMLNSVPGVVQWFSDRLSMNLGPSSNSPYDLMQIIQPL